MFYTVDRAERVVETSPDWDEFALANDGADAIHAAVVGRAIWSFIAGADTKHLLRRVLHAARAGRRVQGVPFRCHGTTHLRSMEFNVEGLGAGACRITTALVREEQPVSPVRLLDRRASRSHELIRMCSWCNRIHADGQWLEIEAGVRALQLFDEVRPPSLSHGICPDCGRTVTAELEIDAGD